MSKRILLIFEPANQKHLVNNLMAQMRKRGLNIEAFNSYKWEYLETDKEIPFLYRILRRFLFVRKIGTLIRKWFHTSVLTYVSEPYDLIDIHFFWRDFVPFLEKTKKPYKITIWGSDFYREWPEFQERKKALYEKALMVQVETDEVKRDILRYDPALVGKVEVCNFGVDVIGVMSHLNNRPLVSKAIKGDRLVVTIGYNGSVAQQHELLLNAVKQLPDSYKQRLYLYVPATYGLSREYETRLIELLNILSIPYTLFNKRLSEGELAQLRKDSDIVLNAQVTDTLNASLLQHLYAGGILIVGDWLPYGIYDRHGILYYTSDKDGFTEKLKYCLDNFSTIKELTVQNREKVLEFATWDAVSDTQYNLFKRL